MTKGSFDERIQHLSDEVGTGILTAGLTVDQPYAQDQHETPYNHPRGGQRKYLEMPLMENAFALVEGLARNAITEQGSDLVREMRNVAETMSEYVEKYAPVDTTRLRNSGSPWVTDGGETIYHRPANAPRRMTPSESGWHRQ